MQRIFKTIRRTKLSWRMTVLFTTFVTLLMLQGVLHAVGLSRARDSLKTIIDRDLRIQQNLFEITLTVQQVQDELSPYLNDLRAGRVPDGEDPAVLMDEVLRLAEESRDLNPDDWRLLMLINRVTQYRDNVYDLIEAATDPNFTIYRITLAVDELSAVLDAVDRTNDTLIEAIKARTQEAIEDTTQTERSMWLFSAAILAVLTTGFFFAINSVIPPLRTMQRDAQAIAAGDMRQRLTVSGNDEISTLAMLFNQMTDKVVGLVDSLESRVAERTRAIEAVFRIGREVASLRSLDDLLTEFVNLVRERLGFYHVQVYLLDDVHAFAVLRATVRSKRSQLVQVRVGSHTPVGQASIGQLIVIAKDDAQSTDIQFDPLLPETRAEIALPLRVGDHLIGVLDIHSRRSEAFNADDTRIFETLANQLAVAIDSARLADTVHTQSREIERLNRQIVRQAWAEFLETSSDTVVRGYRYNLSDVRPLHSDGGLTPSDNAIVMPIRLGAQVVGTLQTVRPDRPFGNDEQAIVRAVAERLGLAIENARLFQRTQHTLQETAALYEGSELINAAETADEVLAALEKSTLAGDADVVLIGLFDRQWVDDQMPDTMTVLAARGRMMQDALQPNITIPLNIVPGVALLSSGEAVVINDVANDPRMDDQARETTLMVGVQSTVAVPLVAGGERIGFVSISRAEPTNFTEDAVRRLTTLAQQAAVALQSQQRLAQTQARADRERLLHAISDEMQRAADLDELMRITAEELNKALSGSQTLLHVGVEPVLRRTFDTPHQSIVREDAGGDAADTPA
jgi:GAF domain-containing protein/HAMP domain-containing protein